MLVFSLHIFSIPCSEFSTQLVIQILCNYVKSVNSPKISAIIIPTLCFVICLFG